MTARIVPPVQPTGALAPGFEDVALFATIEEEYAAFRRGAALVDRSARFRMVATGAKAAEALNGLVTNDVLALAPGAGAYAAALTAKGKIIADLRIFARADDLLIDVPRPAAAGFAAMIRKYVNPRLGTFADRSDTLRNIGVFGPKAHEAIQAGLGLPAHALTALSSYHHITVEVDAAKVTLAAAPDLGPNGYDLFVPVESAAELWSRLAHAGARPAGTAVAEIARVEAGRPLWGTDMDENTLAQEANFDDLAGISYTKGCYTGQETVARVHFRGHVNRALRGLTSTHAIPAGAQMAGSDGAPCGDVRSSVVSPTRGPLAIAMLRRSIEIGTNVTARWDGGECIALVRELSAAR